MDPETSIGLANEADIKRVEAIIVAAYSKYIPRMNTLPAAMKTDYTELAKAGKLHLLRRREDIIGLVCLEETPDSMNISNLAVDTTIQGRGYGRQLMHYGETLAVAKGYSAVTLFANEKMYENLALYEKLGYVETGRRVEKGFHRVYFRKFVGQNEDTNPL